MNQIFHFLSHKLENRRFLIVSLVGLIAWLMLMSTPRFNLFRSKSEVWDVVFLKMKDPTNNLSHIHPADFKAKKVFRLTGPLLMRVFQANSVGIIAIQFIFNIGLWILSYLLLERVLKDKVAAYLFSIALSFTYFGRAGFFDLYYAWFDIFAFFGILLAMYSRHWLVVFGACLFSAWTDERGFIGLGIVFVYSYWANIDFDNPKYFKLNPKTMVVLAAMIAYLGVRKYLEVTYGMKTPNEGAALGMLKRTYPLLPLGIFTFMEGFWIPVVLAFFLAFLKKHYLWIISVFICLFVFTLVAGSVTDITRSGAYALPVAIISIAYLLKYSSKTNLRLVALFTMCICMLFPMLMLCPDIELKYSVMYPGIDQIPIPTKLQYYLDRIQ